jgi:phosphoglycolate phosphatase
MGARFDLLVFDWDGTIVDSAQHIVDSIQAACQDLGLAVPSADDARHIIGLGMHDALSYLLPGLPASDYPRLAERYRCHYLSGDHTVQLFGGVRAGIERLRAAGFLLGVATGKSRRGLERALDDSGLRPYFHASRCADEGFSKPHPEMLQFLMDALGVRPERTLMIGDTSHDLEMARAASVAALAVAYGAHPHDKLLPLEPVACVFTFTEAMAWLSANA